MSPARQVLELLRGNHGRGSSIHERLDVWSGVHRHLREGNITSGNARAVWQQFRADERAGLWHWLGLTERAVRRACEAFERLDPEIFLRSGDALHLACARENGFAEIFSGDRILLGAAAHVGLKGVSVY